MMARRINKKELDYALSQQFKCPKCKNVGANVDRLAMAGTGISRFMEIQAYTYAFVSCFNCGYTEIYNLKTLEGRDDIGSILDILFMN
jgi:predicted nucleic-acid-binding Zn-ribbon protein